MKRIYELEVLKLAEELSDRVWYDFDKWVKKIQNTIGYQIIQAYELNEILHKTIIEKLDPKLNAFINSTKI